MPDDERHLLLKPHQFTHDERLAVANAIAAGKITYLSPLAPDIITWLRLPLAPERIAMWCLRSPRSKRHLKSK